MADSSFGGWGWGCTGSGSMTQGAIRLGNPILGTIASDSTNMLEFKANLLKQMGAEQERLAAQEEAVVSSPKPERTEAKEDRVRTILDWTVEEQALAYIFLQDHAGLTRDRADTILRKAGWR